MFTRDPDEQCTLVGLDSRLVRIYCRAIMLVCADLS